MVFQKQDSVTRDPHIREIEITLFKTIDENHPESPYSVKFRISIDDQLGQPMNNLHGDLTEHLTTVQKTQLKDFVDMIWDKAENEVIK